MLLIRLLALLSFLLSITLIFSINHSIQDSNVDSGTTGASIQEAVVLNQIKCRRFYAEIATQVKFQGRKLVSNNVMNNKVVRAIFETPEASKNSDLKYAERGFQYVENMKNGRKLMSEDDVSGFVAFNADYRGPKHHPPRNN